MEEKNIKTASPRTPEENALCLRYVNGKIGLTHFKSLMRLNGWQTWPDGTPEDEVRAYAGLTATAQVIEEVAEAGAKFAKTLEDLEATVDKK